MSEKSTEREQVAPEPEREETIRDLAMPDADAEAVKGGLAGLAIKKPIDKSSPTL